MMILVWTDSFGWKYDGMCKNDDNKKKISINTMLFFFFFSFSWVKITFRKESLSYKNFKM